MPATKSTIAGYAITRRQNSAAPTPKQLWLLRRLCRKCGVDAPQVATHQEAHEEIQLALELERALGV